MGTRIGIIGGGQLGRMLGFAAKRLGFMVTVVDPTPESPAAQVVDRHIVADLDNEAEIMKLAGSVDYVTFEIERASPTLLARLEKKGLPVYPTAKTLQMIQDKCTQKEVLQKVGIPVAQFRAVKSAEDVQSAAIDFGYPLILKARLDAYDGRGNVRIDRASDIQKALDQLSGRSLYVERVVPFVRELAIMVARSTTGDIALYPVVETIHQNHICHIVKAPANVSTHVKRNVEAIAKRVVTLLDGVGVFGIELFLAKNGDVLVNEIAPRVHNSGHYTIEACVTDQFEQHIRAVTGMPLGITDMTVPAAVMVNILGTTKSDTYHGLDKALAVPWTSVHMYGKKESRPERKMGHITAVDSTVARAYAHAMKARRAIYI